MDLERYNARSLRGNQGGDWAPFFFCCIQNISALLKDPDVVSRNSIKDKLASLEGSTHAMLVGGGDSVGTGDEAGSAIDDNNQ